MDADDGLIDPFDGAVAHRGWYLPDCRVAPPFTERARRGTFRWRFRSQASDQNDEQTPVMSAREARAYLETRLTDLKTKHQRVRYYPMRDCWFKLPRGPQ